MSRINIINNKNEKPKIPFKELIKQNYLSNDSQLN